MFRTPVLIFKISMTSPLGLPLGLLRDLTASSDQIGRKRGKWVATVRFLNKAEAFSLGGFKASRIL